MKREIPQADRPDGARREGEGGAPDKALSRRAQPGGRSRDHQPRAPDHDGQSRTEAKAEPDRRSMKNKTAKPAQPKQQKHGHEQQRRDRRSVTSRDEATGGQAQQPRRADPPVRALRFQRRAEGVGRLARLGGFGSMPEDYVKGMKESDRTALNTKEYVFYGYFQRIRERLDRAWVPILRDRLVKMYRMGRSLASDMDHITQVIVVLNPQGEIMRVQVVERKRDARSRRRRGPRFQSSRPVSESAQGNRRPERRDSDSLAVYPEDLVGRERRSGAGKEQTPYPRLRRKPPTRR